ncbi:MAG: hypothetical protein JEZ07_03410 [Phycisphaerae bacterium]|nr:hypothetical protein [Phycisphaerae bacterium]
MKNELSSEISRQTSLRNTPIKTAHMNDVQIKQKLSDVLKSIKELCLLCPTCDCDFEGNLVYNQDKIKAIYSELEVHLAGCQYKGSGRKRREFLKSWNSSSTNQTVYEKITGR